MKQSKATFFFSWETSWPRLKIHLLWILASGEPPSRSLTPLFPCPHVSGTPRRRVCHFLSTQYFCFLVVQFHFLQCPSLPTIFTQVTFTHVTRYSPGGEAKCPFSGSPCALSPPPLQGCHATQKQVFIGSEYEIPSTMSAHGGCLVTTCWIQMNLMETRILAGLLNFFNKTIYAFSIFF